MSEMGGFFSLLFLFLFYDLWVGLFAMVFGALLKQA